MSGQRIFVEVLDIELCQGRYPMAMLREKLRERGIPVTFTVDLEAQPKVKTGTLTSFQRDDYFSTVYCWEDK